MFCKPHLSLPRLAFGVILFSLVSACGAPQVAQGVNDPYEAENRARHAFNRSVDKAILRPASGAYGTLIPAPVQKGIGNFAANLALPSMVVNDVLQGKIDDAAHNFFRFVFNSTIGIGGLVDFGSNHGLEERTSDFGETLYVWGVGEGPYLEMPILGPATTRDTVGKVVDLFTNPLTFVLDPPEAYVPPAARVFARIGDRYRYSDTVDSVLYESADSYAQARLLYLENRRFKLGSAGGEDAAYDIYEDLYD